MPLFCVLKKKKTLVKSVQDDIEILKIGFNFYAFFFTFIWSLSYGLNSKSFFTICILLVLFCFYTLNLITSFVFSSCIILMSLFWGLFGNDILITKLIEEEEMTPTRLIFSDSQKSVLLAYLSEK